MYSAIASNSTATKPAWIARMLAKIALSVNLHVQLTHQQPELRLFERNIGSYSGNGFYTDPKYYQILNISMPLTVSQAAT